MDALYAPDLGINLAIPVDLVTVPDSGLDLQIRLAAGYYQIPRVPCARGMSEESLPALIEQHAEGRQLDFLGELPVNVRSLNLALDRIQ